MIKNTDMIRDVKILSILRTLVRKLDETQYIGNCFIVRSELSHDDFMLMRKKLEEFEHRSDNIDLLIHMLSNYEDNLGNIKRLSMRMLCTYRDNIINDIIDNNTSISSQK